MGNTSTSNPQQIGSAISIAGSPIFSHSANVIVSSYVLPTNAAATPLGGVPTSVATPPIDAPYAIASIAATPKLRVGPSVPIPKPGSDACGSPDSPDAE